MVLGSTDGRKSTNVLSGEAISARRDETTTSSRVEQLAQVARRTRRIASPSQGKRERTTTSRRGPTPDTTTVARLEAARVDAAAVIPAAATAAMPLSSGIQRVTVAEHRGVAVPRCKNEWRLVKGDGRRSR